MSELSYLEKLLDGVEVEWLSLSKVFNLRNGYTPSKTKKEFGRMVIYLGLEWMTYVKMVEF